MGFIGGFLRVSGKVAGKISQVAIKGTGEIVGTIADEIGADSVAYMSRSISDGLGNASNEVLTKTGNIAGTVIDKSIEVSSEVGGNIGEAIAKSISGNSADAKTGRKIGTIVGGAAAGLIVGDAIGAGITTVTAATATASTGTAISSLSGAAQTSATLAQIGGGTLASGGGGMAAGQAILNGINVATTVDGAQSGINQSANRNNAVKSTVSNSTSFDLDKLQRSRQNDGIPETDDLINKLRNK